LTYAWGASIMADVMQDCTCRKCNLVSEPSQFALKNR